MTYEVINGERIVSFSGTAMEWPVLTEFRTTGKDHPRGAGIEQLHLACARCKQSVFLLNPDSNAGGYETTTLTLAAAVLRHVRERHCDGGGILLDK